jgi:hypothetical protein
VWFGTSFGGFCFTTKGPGPFCTCIHRPRGRCQSTCRNNHCQRVTPPSWVMGHVALLFCSVRHCLQARAGRMDVQNGPGPIVVKQEPPKDVKNKNENRQVP